MHALLKITRLKLSFAGAVCAVALIGSNGLADIAEIEGNDTIATAQVIAPGELVVTGYLGDVIVSNPLFNIPSTTLAVGEVAAFSFNTAQNNLLANTDYIVETSLSSTAPPPSQANPPYDTYLGQFDSAGTGGTLIQEDDDGGQAPFSSFIASTDANGDLFVVVTDFADGTPGNPNNVPFSGTAQAGSFGLTVSEPGVVLSNDDSADFYQFTGLIPNALYTATTSPGDIIGEADTLLAAFDAAGNLIGTPNISDDDGPDANLFYSEIEFFADAGGNGILAISGTGNGLFNGGHRENNDYVLTLTTDAVGVPEPTSVAVLGLVGLCGLARRRRN